MTRVSPLVLATCIAEGVASMAYKLAVVGAGLLGTRIAGELVG